MATPDIQIISILLALVILALAIARWHILRDRRAIFSRIREALNDRKSLWIGIGAGLLYLAVYMILGGRGGRVHILFGRLILNAEPGDILAGLVIAILVAISMSLFVYGARAGNAGVPPAKAGLAGTVLALLACFCP